MPEHVAGSVVARSRASRQGLADNPSRGPPRPMRNVIVVFGAGTRADGRLSVDLHHRLRATLAEARLAAMAGNHRFGWRGYWSGRGSDHASLAHREWHLGATYRRRAKRQVHPRQRDESRASRRRLARNGGHLSDTAVPHEARHGPARWRPTHHFAAAHHNPRSGGPKLEARRAGASLTRARRRKARARPRDLKGPGSTTKDGARPRLGF